MTVLQALAMAGGFKDFANTKDIRVLRRTRDRRRDDPVQLQGGGQGQRRARLPPVGRHDHRAVASEDPCPQPCPLVLPVERQAWRQALQAWRKALQAWRKAPALRLPSAAPSAWPSCWPPVPPPPGRRRSAKRIPAGRLAGCSRRPSSSRPRTTTTSRWPARARRRRPTPSPCSRPSPISSTADVTTGSGSGTTGPGRSTAR